MLTTKLFTQQTKQRQSKVLFKQIVNTLAISSVIMDCESIQMAISDENNLTERKECGRRGRKPGRKTSAEKVDIKAKLERSRQSARECRARKKLRYQYLEELVADREKAVIALRAELERLIQWDRRLTDSESPNDVDQLLKEIGILKQEQHA